MCCSSVWQVATIQTQRVCFFPSSSVAVRSSPQAGRWGSIIGESDQTLFHLICLQSGRARGLSICSLRNSRTDPSVSNIASGDIAVLPPSQIEKYFIPIRSNNSVWQISLYYFWTLLRDWVSMMHLRWHYLLPATHIGTLKICRSSGFYPGSHWDIAVLYFLVIQISISVRSTRLPLHNGLSP